ncbi:unnamed protein product, partial [marine sediment metagenome]
KESENMEHRLAVAVARELLEKRRASRMRIKLYEQMLRDISKTFGLHVDLVNDTVTEVKKKCDI